MRRRLTLLACLALAACSTAPPRSGGGYYLDDGPDAAPRDVSAVPDAVPKHEPRAAYGNKPYVALGRRYEPMADARGYRARGTASWYGKKFHGQLTSSREPYDMYAMTAAHKTLPLPSYVRVRNVQNGRTVVVRVNDRGPFLHDRLIDLSYAAAWKLGIVATGTGVVEIETVHPESPAPTKVTESSALTGEAASGAVPSRPGLELVTPAVADSRPLAPVPKIYVQLGAFAQPENAEALRARAERASLGPVTVQPGQGAARYRVRVGPLADAAHGARLAEHAQALGFERAKVVSE
jgi:rare lipoprotein A